MSTLPGASSESALQKSGTSTPAEGLPSLESQYEAAKKRLDGFRLGYLIAIVFLALFLVVVIPAATYWLQDRKFLISIIAGSVGVILLTAIIAQRMDVKGARENVKDLQDELEVRDMQSASLEQKAHKLLRIQQVQLSRYFDLIFQQSKGIFWVGVISMALGFVIIGVTMYYTGSDLMNRKAPDANLIYDKIVVGTVGAIGGILTNFVGAIYLKMFSEIVQSVNKSVGVMTVSTNMNFANVVIATISKEDLRDQALRELAVNLKAASGS